MEEGHHPADAGRTLVRPSEGLRTLAGDEGEHLATLVVEAWFNDPRRGCESFPLEVAEQGEHRSAPRSRLSEDDVTAAPDDRRAATAQFGICLVGHAWRFVTRRLAVKAASTLSLTPSAVGSPSTFHHTVLPDRTGSF